MSESKPGESKSSEGASQRRLLIPSFLTPSGIKGEEKRERRERRLRIRRRSDVDEGKAKIHPEVLKELGIEDEVEIVLVGGGSRERKYVLKVIPSEDVPRNEVWCNEEEMRRLGVADNSIATIRKPLGPKEEKGT